MKTKKRSKAVLSLVLVLALLFAFPFSACGPTEYEEEGIAVKFDYNDGVSRPLTLSVGDGESVSAPADPLRNGYDFVKWYTEAEGGSEVAFPLTPSGDVTVYAHWKAMICSVTFDENYDGGDKTVEEVEFGKTVERPAENPERTNYTFYRWEVSKNGGAEVVFPYTVKGHVTFYARWVTGDILNIKLDMNYENAAEGATLNVPQGDRLTAAQLGTPKRSGYKFVGWGTSPTATEAIELPYTPTESGTLYAIWEKEQYTISFRNNFVDAPSVNFKSVKVDGGTKVEEPEDKPVREGFTFEGWYTNERGGTPIVFPLEAVRTTNVYAHWKSVAVKTNIFDAEYTEIDPTEIFPGYSGSATGAQIVTADDTGGTTHSEKYPLNSKKPSHIGHYVTYLYKEGATLKFVIYSDKAVDNVKLSASLGYEILDTGSLTIAPTGDNAYSFVVNGKALSYSPITITGRDISGGGMFKSTFAEYTVSANVSLVAGMNVIELVTANANGALAGTTSAVAPMVDFIKLDNLGGAELHWFPVFDNLYL